MPSSTDEGKEDHVICPRPDDEPIELFQLSGFGSASNVCVELSGWSSYIALGIQNVPENLKLKDMAIDEQGNIHPSAQNLLDNKVISLRDMKTMLNTSGKLVKSCPIYVQVIAKKNISVIPHNRKLLILSFLVIADQSGYCSLCSFNEGMETIYKAVEVGDFLLLTTCQAQVPAKELPRDLFADDMLLNMEMKIQFHSVKYHYIRRFTKSKMSAFKMPENLFSQYAIKLPSELETGLSDSSSPKPYDIVGVISYVGRIERFTMNKSVEVENGNGIAVPLNFFLAFRWISIVDKDSKEIPVKVFVYSGTVESQSSLVPGAVVVITHCQSDEDEYTACRYVSTTPYSQIYTGGSIERYSALHPAGIKEKLKSINVRSKYLEIIFRKDVEWRVGGTLVLKHSSEEKFSEVKLKLHRDLATEFNLSRRETKRMQFEGRIFRAMKVMVYDPDYLTTVVSYLHPQYSEELKTKPTKYRRKTIQNFSPLFTDPNVYWYSFTHKLPSLNPEDFKNPKSRDVEKMITTRNRKYCKPLLIPAETNSTDPTGYSLTADLPTIDGPPYILLDIVNRKTQSWYTCMLKRSCYSLDEMLLKIENAKDKTIVCLADVFCIEKGFPYEVNLLDFAIQESSTS